VGKTHLAIALGICTIEAGLSVYFTRFPNMIQNLTKAGTEGNIKQKMRNYLSFPLFIVERKGYLSLNREEAVPLVQLVSGRHERGQIILTSNRSYGAWSNIFPDNITTAAILDGLLRLLAKEWDIRLVLRSFW